MDLFETRAILSKLLAKYDQYKDDKSFITNEKGACESLILPFIREIWHYDTSDPSEFKVEEPKSGKRIDYVVYNQSISQFIIEAKAPSKELFNNFDFYQQAVSYGYSKNRDFAILINFRQIVILACKIKFRVIGDCVLRKIDLLKATNEDLEWLNCFEKEYWISSGRQNKLYSLLGAHKSTIPVDEQLLEDLKEWRGVLLTNIRKNPKNKFDFDDEREFMHLEEEIQKFIDRLIFICFCEDKELEEPQLKSLLYDKKERFSLKPGYLLLKIQELFDFYRLQYNSDLFDKDDCDRLFIDDDKLIIILECLREPKNRVAYNFESIEADILGKTYEQFIGHIQTGQKRFKEKEDLGKRKKEGIYYTPKYIVDYIVNNTVQEYVRGKSFEEIKKVRILDPACGSGSFLLRAFEVLLEECEQKLKRKLIYEEKRELMLNCIYGVDLDKRATEIAKLNLSLKMAERGQKLPMLRENIRHGNSLIDDPEVAGWYAFNWQEQFKEIMDSGGFDVVVGNPPYFNISRNDPVKNVRYFEGLGSGIINSAALFMKRSFDLLTLNGLFGFIVPKSLLYVDSWAPIRTFLFKKSQINSVVDVSKAFVDVKLEQVIITYSKINPNLNKKVILKSFINNQKQLENTVTQGDLLENNLFVFDKISFSIYKKLNLNYILLGKISENFRGIGAQKYTNNESKFGGVPMFGGKEINRYLLRSAPRFIDSSKLKEFEVKLKRLSQERILVQNIVAHIRDHIKITATYDPGSAVVLDTVNNIIITNNQFSLKYILALLNSKLISYYIYNYIYFRAIRTMHFDGEYSGRIPIRKISTERQKTFIQLVDKILDFNHKIQKLESKMLELKKKLEKERDNANSKIDELVYKLYGITEEEKKIIEESLK